MFGKKGNLQTGSWVIRDDRKSGSGWNLGTSTACTALESKWSKWHWTQMQQGQRKCSPPTAWDERTGQTGRTWSWCKHDGHHTNPLGIPMGPWWAMTMAIGVNAANAWSFLHSGPFGEKHDWSPQLLWIVGVIWKVQRKQNGTDRFLRHHSQVGLTGWICAACHAGPVQSRLVDAHHRARRQEALSVLAQPIRHKLCVQDSKASQEEELKAILSDDVRIC